MANVEMNASGFRQNYTHVNGTTYEDISKFDVCRAAITLGASGHLDLISYGWRYLAMRVCEGFHRSFLVRSNRGNLEISNVFIHMDQTEKATATYWLGMAFTKLAAERRLRIPWLCHVDRLIDQGVLTLATGTNERGDLVGKDHNKEWHVLESKGRSYNVSSTLIHQAKFQATRITAINGRPPCSASACIVRLFNTPITVDLIDPERDYDIFEVLLHIMETDFYDAYYNPFIRYLRLHTTKKTRVFNLDFEIAEIKSLGAGIWVGLPKEILNNPANAEMVAEVLYNRKVQEEDSEISLGYDGIILTKGHKMEFT